MSAIEQLAQQYDLGLCVECGKCVAVCPMAVMFEEFTYASSPRGIIETILIGEREEALGAESFWFCLTCDLCTDLCPAGVRFRDFVEDVRHIAVESGMTEYGLFCRHCGTYLRPWRAVQYLKEALGEDAEDMLTLCPRCRQYDFAGRVKALKPGDRKAYPAQTFGGAGR